MGRRGSLLEGQLNMFELLGNPKEKGQPNEVEMVSLFPEAEKNTKLRVENAMQLEEERIRKQEEAHRLREEKNAKKKKEMQLDVLDLNLLEEEVASQQEEKKAKSLEHEDVKVYVPRHKRGKEEENKGFSSEDVVMHQEVRDDEGKIIAEISYINYNKVYIQKVGEIGEIKIFDSSKEAVNFYIEELQNFAGGIEE